MTGLLFLYRLRKLVKYAKSISIEIYLGDVKMKKEKVITIEKKGRDYGKRFKIREMSARQLEDWTIELVAALINSGIDISEDSGIADVATEISRNGLGFLKNIKLEYVKPLYDRLLECVEYIGENGKTNPVARSLTNDTADEVIEEVGTLFALRGEVVKLHFDFLNAAEG